MKNIDILLAGLVKEPATNLVAFSYSIKGAGLSNKMVSESLLW
ncbi:hypothetical protein ACQKP0_15540 [Heyndrickxia sp. NPDC080065]